MTRFELLLFLCIDTAMAIATAILLFLAAHNWKVKAKRYRELAEEFRKRRRR